MLISLFPLLMLLPACGPAPVAAEAAVARPTPVPARREPEHARPRLIAEKAAATPGSTIWVAVTFEMDEGWHIYWDGQNDSGMPVSGPWKLSEHITMDKLEWPTPKRAVDSNIHAIDYIYEKRATALAQLTIGEDVKPGQTIKIDASLKWLVCREQCKGGKKDVSLELKIVAPGSAIEDSADAPLFQEARKSIPKSAKEGESIVSRHWTGNTLTLAVQNASGLIFYPDAKCAPMSDAIGEGESKSGELKLGFEAKSGSVGAVSGIVEVRRADSKPTEYYTVTIPGKERKE